MLYGEIWSSETWSPTFMVLAASVFVAAILIGVIFLLAVLLVRSRRLVTRQRVSQRVNPVMMTPSLVTSAENWLPPPDESSDYLVPLECRSFQQHLKLPLEETEYAEITGDFPAAKAKSGEPASSAYEHLILPTKITRNNPLN